MKSKSNVDYMSIDHFRRLAPGYDILFKPRFDESWLQLLALPAQGMLLDIGGGTGRLSQYFTTQAKQVLILDLSARMLRQAQQKNGFLLAQGAAERLPFTDGSIERVAMIDALHHLEDQAQAVREMVRILKPGGRLMIEEPDIRSLGIKAVALLEKVLGMGSRFLHGEETMALFNGLTVQIRLERKKGVFWIVGEKKLSLK